MDYEYLFECFFSDKHEMIKNYYQERAVSSHCHIPSIAYSDKINDLCSELKRKCNLEYYCLGLCLPPHPPIYLSNMYHWALAYHELQISSLDDTIHRGNEKKLFYIRDTKTMLPLEKKMFELHNSFGIKEVFMLFRYYSGIKLVMMAKNDICIPDPYHFMLKQKKNFEEFSVLFLKNLMPEICEIYPFLKGSRFTVDFEYMSDIIKNKLCDTSISLTPREIEVLYYISNGRRAKEIGTELNISQRTVEHYISEIKFKFNSSNIVHAATSAVRAGLI